MNKDWTGNKKSTFTTLGASNHTSHERAEYDYYATEPKAADLLLEVEDFRGTIWENACGEGHLSKQMEKHGCTVISSDLIDRGYGQGGIDFFKTKECMGDNIVTNPPYKYAQEWVEHSMKLLEEEKKLALFLKLTFLEGDKRKRLFKKYPPYRVYVSSNRIMCGMNGNFYELDDDGNVVYNKDGTPKKMSSATAYAWFVWKKGYTGETVVKWIN